MLIDGLKSVSPRTALVLVLGGAASVVVALLIINSGSSRAGIGSPQPHHPRHAMPIPTSRKDGGNEPLAAAQIRKLVGQRFMVGLRGTSAPDALLEDAREGMIGGVVLFPEGAGESAVRQVVEELQAAAKEGGNPPLLIATDQEGGPVKRFPQGPPDRPLASLLPGQTVVEGQRTGAFLGEMGINTNLAPVVDLGLPDSFIAREGRTISPDPRTVGEVGAAFAVGLQQTLTLAVAKHFPGLGVAPVNTDLQRTEVTAATGQSLEPFRTVIRAGVKGVMVSTAAYRSLDPGRGAAWSPRIVTGLLRGKLSFDGLVFSDDLSTAGVNEWLSTPAAAAAAAKAGVDILIVGEPNSFRAAFRAVVKAAEGNELSRRELEDSYRRIGAEKEWLR